MIRVATPMAIDFTAPRVPWQQRGGASPARVRCSGRSPLPSAPERARWGQLLEEFCIESGQEIIIATGWDLVVLDSPT
jgi:hypothetical protein